MGFLIPWHLYTEHYYKCEEEYRKLSTWLIIITQCSQVMGHLIALFINMSKLYHPLSCQNIFNILNQIIEKITMRSLKIAL